MLCYVVIAWRQLLDIYMDICFQRKLHTENYKSHTKPFSIPPSDKLAFTSMSTQLKTQQSRKRLHYVSQSVYLRSSQ